MMIKSSQGRRGMFLGGGGGIGQIVRMCMRADSEQDQVRISESPSVRPHKLSY